MSRSKLRVEDIAGNDDAPVAPAGQKPVADPYPDLALLRPHTIQFRGQMYSRPAGYVFRYTDNPELYAEVAANLKGSLSEAAVVHVCPSCRTAFV